MLILTSSPCVVGCPDMNPANGLTALVREALPGRCRALFVCSSPDTPELTDAFASDMRRCFASAGIVFTEYAVLDDRTADRAELYISRSDLIILAGGHVPTQLAFFHRIGLREKLRSCPGLIFGISAGSMNSADTVYIQPELPGEAADPAFARFGTGLGLTQAMIWPHFQESRHAVLDGLRLLEDITLPDSRGRTFYALPDGSYLLSRDGRTELRGEAWQIRDGTIRQISADGESLPLPTAP